MDVSHVPIPIGILIFYEHKLIIGLSQRLQCASLVLVIYLVLQCDACGLVSGLTVCSVIFCLTRSCLQKPLPDDALCLGPWLVWVWSRFLPAPDTSHQTRHRPQNGAWTDGILCSGCINHPDCHQINFGGFLSRPAPLIVSNLIMDKYPVRKCGDWNSKSLQKMNCWVRSWGDWYLE